MNKGKLTVLMLGRLPPPIGGVTVSVENLFLALISKSVEVSFLFSGLKRRYDIAHIHAYNAKKRLLLTLLAKVFAKRVVFTIHGMHFDENNYFNRQTLKLVDGVIILNNKVLSLAPNLTSLPLLKVSSLTREGLQKKSTHVQLLPSVRQKPRLLVYAQHGNSFDGEPIYGVPFVLSVLPQLVKRYELVVVDLSHAFPELKEYADQGVVHITAPVDFKQLLTEVDVYLRPTSKDGDSVAVREAAMLDVPVVASDVVERITGVITYRYLDASDFLQKINYALTSQPTEYMNSLSSVEQYISFYQSLLSGETDGYKRKLC